LDRFGSLRAVHFNEMEADKTLHSELPATFRCASATTVGNRPTGTGCPCTSAPDVERGLTFAWFLGIEICWL